MIRIDFSGIDGCGKTTMLQFAKEYLENNQVKVGYLKEVGNPSSPACVKLREIFLDRDSRLTGESVELICAAMRIENEKYLDYLRASECEIVLSDRGWLDHLAYGDVNCDMNFMDSLFDHIVAVKTCQPDYILLFDIDPANAKNRRTIRGEAVDAIEAKGETFLTSVSDAFKCRAVELMDNNSHGESTEILIVDANQTIENVKSQIRYLLDAIIVFKNNEVKFLAVCGE